MDPLVIIVEELHDLVFQHFLGQDVKNAFLCSKNWNVIVSESKVCMSKIKIDFSYTREDNVVNDQIRKLYNFYVRAGPRPYQNLDINVKKGITAEIPKECFQILELMIPFLTDIVLMNVIASDIDVGNKFLFPNLQYLRIEFCSQRIYDVFLKSSKNLISLELSSEDIPIEIALLFCLKTNTNLKFLHCRVNVFHMIFKTDVADLFKFQLEKFFYETEQDYHQTGAVTHENFLKFLKNNCLNLEVIELQTADTNIVNCIINEMKYVREVVIRMLTKNSDINFNKNRSVELLEVNYIKTVDELKPFIDCLPNLKTLNVAELDSDMVFYAATYLVHLTALTYEMIDLNTMEYYENLKVTVPNINKNIDIDW